MGEVSRQRRWQLRHAETGLCISCASRRLPTKERCFRHHVLRLFARVGLPAQGRGYANLRDHQIAFLYGKYRRMVDEGVWEEIDVVAQWKRASFNRVGNAPDRFARVLKSVRRLSDTLGKEEAGSGP